MAHKKNTFLYTYNVFIKVVDGQRELIQTHSLKKRHFIGNTSMDAQLALVMANQARVDHADVIYDPFVGSGSLFIAAAHFGGELTLYVAF